MPKGKVAFEAGHSFDQSQHSVHLLTVTGNDSLPLRPSSEIDYMLVWGLGAGFELGFGTNVMVKYSVLDEQRKSVPFSLAVALNVGGTGASTGILASRHYDLGKTVAIRPVFNAMVSAQTVQAVNSIPEELSDPEFRYATMTTKMEILSYDFPLGFELPISVGEKRTLTPTASFTYSVPMSINMNSFSCNGCAFAIDRYETGSMMRLWVGLRLQPKLVLKKEASL